MSCQNVDYSIPFKINTICNYKKWKLKKIYNKNGCAPNFPKLGEISEEASTLRKTLLSSKGLINASIIIKLAGHPRSGCPARLRGHKGSGLWKVWTVPCPPPSPPLPSLPPSRVPNLIKLGPAVWPKLQPAEARECSAALAISEWTRRLSAIMRPCWSSRGEKCCFENVELRELWFESGLMNGPVHDLKGKWSECHRVRNAKRPREGSNSRTVPYYYIDVVYEFPAVQQNRNLALLRIWGNVILGFIHLNGKLNQVPRVLPMV